MAMQILRTIDRWRFEAPLALVLAAAAGFAAMAMPHDLFARVPVAGGYGRAGHVALALVAALVLGALGYLAMRRPTKPVVRDEDAYIEDVQAPMAAPVADVAEEGPVRLRRADRHPDAPPRAPIRASRDLGEPFMEIGTPVAPASETEWSFVEEPAHSALAAEGEESHPEETVVEPVVEPVEAEQVDAIEPVSAEAETDLPGDEIAVHHDEPVALSPQAQTETTSVAPEPVSRPLPANEREDTSIDGMIERLSSRMQRTGEPVGRPFRLAKDRKPALRDALDTLNRLAQRRG